MSRGINRERQVRKILEADGWWTCRAAGSFGDADVVAVRHHGDLMVGQYQKIDETPGIPEACEVLFVEVKSTAGGPFEHFRPKDRAELLEAARQCGATPLLCWWPPRKQPEWFGAKDWPAAKVAA